MADFLAKLAEAETITCPAVGLPGTINERTFIAIKPDGVQRNLVGNIIGRFEERGFKLVALKMIWPTKEQAAGHYSDLSSKGFFDGLCNYFSSGPIVAMVWEGKGVIATGRSLLGATNPADSAPGTIRGDLCIDIGRNICHGSDSKESAAKEIGFWFHPSELQDWNDVSQVMVYENPRLLQREHKTIVDKIHGRENKSEEPLEGKAGDKTERTFIAIKPDGVQRRKVGNIIRRFEARGFKLAAIKMIWPTKEQTEAHYSDLAGRSFFGGLVEYFSSGPIVAMIWEGKGSIKTGRVLLGATNPADSAPGSIRGDLCIDVGRNICHGSDCDEAAAKEIAHWFVKDEVNNYESVSAAWIYE